jgi:tetratricopeptide (TPR) repeat protein
LYAAELNRPNLDTYLSRMYHDESELIAVFLCKEYNTKEWCGLEWRACRDVLKHKEDARLMFFRLDDADILGLYSIDGYQDIRDMADAEVAAAIVTRLDGTSSFAYIHRADAPPHRSFTSKLPIVDPTLIGRDPQLALLDRAWADPATSFVQVIAAGGTGKTALVDKWFRRHYGEATIFGWSFFSRGSSPGRQTSSDEFFDHIIRWFEIGVRPTDSIYIKAEAIAARFRDERVMLLLDGVEPLQESSGALRDAPLRALLQELATGHRGLVVCTTRVSMDIPEAIPLDLDNLTPHQGAEYLRGLGVEGTDEELEQASQEYWNHALALTLLGSYLVDFCGSDIRRRVEIPKVMITDVVQGAHARRVIAAYHGMFADKPEAAILQALGYFDRPAEPAALRLVLPAMEDRRYRAGLKRLQGARLILTTGPALDCHPLVREHFAGEATPEGHSLLYEHYTTQAPRWPDTIQEMTPLFQAVHHGCQAGRHQAALDDVYRDRILRGKELYLANKLGAFGTSLSLLVNFFETPWTQPVAKLSPEDQTWLIGEAGSTLRIVGQLTDAVGPMRVAAESYVKSGNWKNAAHRYGNFSQLNLTLGNTKESIAVASQAVDFADRSGDGFQRMARRTNLADALHQFGDLAEAKRLLEEAERLQAEIEPARPILSSIWGYRYCELLLEQGQFAEVLVRASRTLVIAERDTVLLDMGLDHLSLGRAHSCGSSEATYHLDQAVRLLRRAGTVHHVPRGLLARGKPRDLEQVFRIATRSGMRLHLVDYHLASAHLTLTSGDLTQARTHFANAEILISETGYHRRDPVIEKLRRELD